MRQQDGGASIEFVLVLPVFLLIVALIVDASMLLFHQSQAYRVIQDANRNMSIGRFGSPEETSAFVMTTLGGIAPGTTAESIVTDGVVVTTASLPMAGIQLTGLLSAFDDGTIGVTATHVLER